VREERLIVVFDFETNSRKHADAVPVEVACLAIDPLSLKVVPGSEFETLMRPVDMNTLDDTEDKRKSLAVSGITRDMVADAPVVEAGIRRFHDHLKRLGGRKKVIPAGFNIMDYDLPIYDRLCQEFSLGKGGKNPNFATSVRFDAKEDVNRWFWQNGEVFDPSLDGLRDFLGMKSAGAHRAAFDVRQEAALVVKFLKLYTQIGKTVKFRGSCRANGGCIE
jgi:DNA polymerase III epsilon subunit-like protein